MNNVIYAKIMKHDAYIPFDQSVLPKELSLKEILGHFNFLSPTILLLHGSHISKKRYSPSGKPDLDIICVSRKAAFWPLNQLYDRFYTNIKNLQTKIDLSILTYSQFLSVFQGNASLSISLNNGFTILYLEDINEQK